MGPHADKERGGWFLVHGFCAHCELEPALLHVWREEVAGRFEEMVMRRRIPMVVITVHAYVQNDTVSRLLKTIPFMPVNSG